MVASVILRTVYSLSHIGVITIIWQMYLEVGQQA
jgi:hypothetical protein